MKRFVILSIVALFISGCFKKFEGINDDNEMFARLSKGNGTWEITKVEEWNALDANPSVTTTKPDSSFFHFYLRSDIVFGSVIDLKYGEYYENNVLSNHATISAQSERVVFEGLNVGDGTLYTVEKNTSSQQIWLLMENDNATRFYLKKCNCILPNQTSEENGG